MQRPNLVNASFANPALCRLDPTTKRYDFLPPAMNDGMCFGISFFRTLFQSPASRTITDIFSPCYYIATVVVTYEQFRQPGFLAKLGLPLLFVGQFASAAVALPLYFAIVIWARKSAISDKNVSVVAPPKAEQVWTVLLATVVGYVVPTLRNAHTRQSYDALALWQFFPLYILAMSTVLPTLLRPFLKKTSTTVPIFLIGLIGVYLSASAQFKMLISGLKYRDIWLAWVPYENSLVRDVHYFFVIDLAVLIVATITHIILSYEGDGEETIGYTMFAVLLSLLLGPGAAASILWTWRENFDYKTPIGVPRTTESDALKFKPRPARQAKVHTE